MSDETPTALDDFRAAARTWLRENAPRTVRPSEGPEVREYDCAWQQRQFEGGWAGIDWPREFGGLGLDYLRQIVWYEEVVRSGAPTFSSLLVALNNIGPTLMMYGTEAQKKRHLNQILRGEQVWCQGFSEPEAGSDLAGLKARAVVDGTDLVITGQKIWTSFAQFADFSEVLVRTNDEGRHRGLTVVIVDMTSPGIDVRPLRQLDGTPEFCEVFFDNVRVPLENVIGERDNGWAVARATLSVERGPANLDMRLASLGYADELVTMCDEIGIEDDGLLARLADVRADAAAVRAMAYLQAASACPGSAPGPETTAVRTFHVLLEQRVAQIALDLLGHEALATSRWSLHWLRQFMSTIGGGTTDIQRNIIAEQVMGIPR